MQPVLALSALVRRDAYPSSVVMGTPERVEFHLEQWAIWKRGGWTAALRTGHGGTPEYSGSTHLDEMERQMDTRCAVILDTLIDDLSVAHPSQGAALHHRYLRAVYRFSERYPYARALAEAKVAIGRGLVRKGIY